MGNQNKISLNGSKTKAKWITFKGIEMIPKFKFIYTMVDDRLNEFVIIRNIPYIYSHALPPFSIYLNSWHALSNGLRGSVGRTSHWRSAKCIDEQHKTQDWHFWHQYTIVRPKVAEASQFELANAGTVSHLKFDRPLPLIVWSIFFIKLF